MIMGDCKWSIVWWDIVVLYCDDGTGDDSVLYVDQPTLHKLPTWVYFSINGTLPKGKDYSNLYYSKL